MVEYLLIYIALYELKDLISIHDTVMKAELFHGRSPGTPSSIHVDDHRPDHNALSIATHLQVHSAGVDVIESLTRPSVVCDDGAIQTFQEVIGGNLNHWAHHRVGDKSLGEIAEAGLRKLGSRAR